MAAKTAAVGLSAVLAAPNATPTAKPSGILCKVIEKTNKIVRFKCVGRPSFRAVGQSAYGEAFYQRYKERHHLIQNQY